MAESVVREAAREYGFSRMSSSVGYLESKGFKLDGRKIVIDYP